MHNMNNQITASDRFSTKTTIVFYIAIITFGSGILLAYLQFHTIAYPLTWIGVIAWLVFGGFAITELYKKQKEQK